MSPRFYTASKCAEWKISKRKLTMLGDRGIRPTGRGSHMFTNSVYQTETTAKAKPAGNLPRVWTRDKANCNLPTLHRKISVDWIVWSERIGHWIGMVVQDEVAPVLGGPKAAATLDEIANAAESTRPQEDDMFSPRSSAAMTLTSIAMQPPPQQALFTSQSETPASEPDLQKSFSADLDFAEDEVDDYFLDARQAFHPPRESFAQRSTNSQIRTLSDHTSKPSAAKIRRISVGNTKNTDENAPSFMVSENRSEPTLPPSYSKDSFNAMPFSTSRTQSYGPSVFVSSYTIGPCAFSVTRSNPPPATAADFLPPPWTTPKWGHERPVYPSLVPNSYSMQPKQWEINQKGENQHHPSRSVRVSSIIFIY